jgi:hypothetical protein
MFQAQIPPGIPFGVYIIEAAILEPELGVTLHRSGTTLQIVP